MVAEIAIRATADHRADFDRAAYVMHEFGAMGLVSEGDEVDVPEDLYGADEGGTLLHVTPFVLCEGAFANSEEQVRALQYMRLIAEGLSHPVQPEPQVLESEPVFSQHLGT